MGSRVAILGVIVFILIFASGCLDVAVTSSVNSGGAIERYEVAMSMTGTVYNLLAASATSGGYGSVKEMIEHPRDQTGANPDFNYQEEWDREKDRVTITATAKNPNGLRDRKSISVVRDGEFMVYREDMSSLPSSATSSRTENPFSNSMSSIVTVSYTLTMPGEIIESNANTITGNTAVWHLTTSSAPMIYAKSKIAPFPVMLVAVACVAVLVLAVIGVVAVRRQGRGPNRVQPSPGAIAPWPPALPSDSVPVPATQPETAPDSVIAGTITYTPIRRPDSVRPKAMPSRETADRSDLILKYVLIGGIVLLVVLLVGTTIEAFLDAGPPAGPTAGSAPLNATETVPTLPQMTIAPAVVANAAAAPAMSGPLRIDGTGDDVAVFTANGAELRIFSMRHAGSGWFFVEVIDGAGGTDFLASNYGQYSGRASDWLDSGQYTLQVRANGPWTIEVSPAVSLKSGPGAKPVPTTQAPATARPVTFATIATVYQPPVAVGTVSDPVYAPRTPLTTIATIPSPLQQQQRPQPRYQPGDIVYDRPTNQNSAWVILGYDAGTDEYRSDVIFRYQDGHWGYRLADTADWNQRKFIEATYATLIAHVDPSAVAIGYPGLGPITTTPTPAPITTTLTPTPEPITTTPTPTPEPITTTPTPKPITDPSIPQPPSPIPDCDTPGQLQPWTTTPSTLPLPFPISTAVQYASLPTPPVPAPLTA